MGLFGKKKNNDDNNNLPFPAPHPRDTLPKTPWATIPDQRPKWGREEDTKKTSRRR